MSIWWFVLRWGDCCSHLGRCSWGALWERDAVVVIRNALHGPLLLALVVMGLAPPPLRNNLPMGCWPPLERRDNQPPLDWPPLGVVLPPLEQRYNQPLMDRPPLGVVLPPLEGELFGVLLVLRVLCCIVPLLLQLHFLPPRFW
jgi:hypothetical protein